MSLALLSQPTVLLLVIAILLLVIVIGLLMMVHNRLKTSTTTEDVLQALMERSSSWDEHQSRISSKLESNNEQLTHLLYTQIGDVKSSNTASLAQQKQYIYQLFSEQKQGIEARLHEQLMRSERAAAELRESLTAILSSHKEQFNHNQNQALSQLTEHLNVSTRQSREELGVSLQQNAKMLGEQMSALTKSTDERLKDISGQVERRLNEGFEKTTETFNAILKRLALIDVAQKTITSLSNDVVSLQEVLADKRSRGAFGEVQLNALVRNVLPESQFAFQHTLSNGRIADCVLFLPKPTGNVAIDSKFPLESYQKMTDFELADVERKLAERQFKQDVKKHITDINDRYLLKNETAEGAVMFIPAEAVFAEIHAHHPDVLDYAYKKRVWLASPTTLMAILTTARSVIKDQATQQQVHIIQEHLVHLGEDFGRFKTRFDNLAKHIDQAASDVQKIHISAGKISDRFNKIEKVEIREDLLDTHN